jgi:AcrR family transcriptional regulator
MPDGRVTRGEATRQRILGAARLLFGEHGYEHTSIEDVLDASGMTRGALYHHFPSKTALYDTVLEAVVRDLAGRASSEAHGGDALANLRAGARAWMAMAREPSVQRIYLLDPQAAVGWARWRELDERYWLGGLRASFGRLAEEGRVPRGQERFLAYMLCAALTEAALFIAYARDQASAADIAQEGVDLLLDRLLAGDGGAGAPSGPRSSAA